MQLSIYSPLTFFICQPPLSFSFYLSFCVFLSFHSYFFQPTYCNLLICWALPPASLNLSTSFVKTSQDLKNLRNYIFWFWIALRPPRHWISIQSIWNIYHNIVYSKYNIIESSKKSQSFVFGIVLRPPRHCWRCQQTGGVACQELYWKYN